MQWTDEQVDLIIGRLLRAGVITAAVAVSCGGVWYLLQYGRLTPDYHIFRGEPSELRSVSGVLKGLSERHCRSFIQFGLLLLIATPIARVAFSVVAFAFQRDRVYVVMTVAVLALLLGSLSGLVR